MGVSVELMNFIECSLLGTHLSRSHLTRQKLFKIDEGFEALVAVCVVVDFLHDRLLDYGLKLGYLLALFDQKGFELFNLFKDSLVNLLS